MITTGPTKGCWPTELQELLLKTCLLEGDRALEAWQEWDARSGFDSLDPGSYRLLPLLYTKLSRAGVQHPMMGKLKGIHRRAWSEAHVLSWKLARAVRLLEDHGIATLLLKGIPLAALFYSDVALRPMSDIDVLVPEAQAPAALELLQANGWTRKDAHLQWLREENRGSWLARNVLPVDEELEFQIQYAIGLIDSERRELDLHWHVLLFAPFPGADKEFWEGAIPFTFAGVESRTLCATDHLLHACAHGVMWNRVPSVRWVADSATIMRTASIDWGRLIMLTDRLHVTLPVTAALQYLVSVLKLPVPAEVLKQLTRLKVARTDQRAYRRLQSSEEASLGWAKRRYPYYLQLTEGRDLIFKLRLMAGWSVVRLRRLVRRNRLSKRIG